jgi:signal transduction histidine kinase
MAQNSTPHKALALVRVKQDAASRVSTAPPTYEAALATKIAGVKVILAVLNLAVILIDRTVPAADTPFALIQSLTIGAIFLLYMLVNYAALKNNWVTIQFHRATGPLLDVVFSALLILGTDGYLSPFNIWLTMSIVSASFSSDSRVVLTSTGLALVLAFGISAVPQVTPLDVPVFITRTGFLLAFGLVIGYIGNHLGKKSMLLNSMDSYAAAAASCDSVSSATEVLLTNLAQSIQPRALVLTLDDGSAYSWGDPKTYAPTATYPVATGTVQFGELQIAPATTLTGDDTLLLHTMLDRFCLTLRRIYAAEELLKSASQESRLRLADELHDTHVQTLTAIDLQVEAMFSRPRLTESTRGDLLRIRKLARESLVSLREFISNGPIESSDDIHEIVDRAKRNWPGTFEFDAPENLQLARGAWVAIEVLLREGIANGKRHGHADWARFTIEDRAGIYIVTLQTNGQSPELPLKRQGYGLTRVAGAVAGAGGQMFFTARQDGGASLSAVFGGMVS